MNALITGANGFIGKHLIDRWIMLDDVRIFALTRVDNNKWEKIHHLTADVLDEYAIDNIFQEHEFDVVVHLAALTEHDAIVNHKYDTFDVNLRGTTNILKAFNKYCKDALFVFASTGKVYGKTNELPITEHALTNPTNILGKSKRIVEEVIDFYAEPYNKYLICRIFNVFGEYQKRNFVLPTIIEQLDEEKICLGNTRDFRDYIYIDDCVNALLACINSQEKLSNVDIINIGSGEPISVLDIMDVVRCLTGKELKVMVEEKRKRKDETFAEYCDNSKLVNLSGWCKEFSLEAAIEKTLKAEGIL